MRMENIICQNLSKNLIGKGVNQHACSENYLSNRNSGSSKKMVNNNN